MLDFEMALRFAVSIANVHPRCHGVVVLSVIAFRIPTAKGTAHHFANPIAHDGHAEPLVLRIRAVIALSRDQPRNW
jgi:hypothetical protein